ncbi:WcbI family polysaccharide biosynthesis putative acetyltransferase [Herbiconiux liukaitaii]|uniref:WcbI family polysaccharide biosynthesis putative acetyltransferase n=1 Tax=Herbiconiux liukaitaii TaxID=3342799 RepID=UPI0035BA20FD
MPSTPTPLPRAAVAPSTPPQGTVDEGRRRHFARFYGLDTTDAGQAIPGPTDAGQTNPGPTDARPIGLVFGNCQAESLRLALPVSTAWVRMPPVHELTAADVPHLEALLAVAGVLISQPVHDDYHGLPLGTRQLFARVPSDCRTAVMPVIRSAGLYPTHAIVRPPSDPSLTPPVAPYHDLRTLAEAAGDPLPPLTVAAVLAIAELSQRELRSRESRHEAVVISDLFDRPGFELMRTINHPGNPVWTELATRVADHLGLEGPPAELDRPLLNGIHAPRNPVVIEAWGLETPSTGHWTIDGVQVTEEELRAIHLDWYREHPDVVTAGVARHRTALDLLAAS